MTQEQPVPMTMRLHALYGGAYTQLTITGPMPTAPPEEQLCRLFRLLSFWSARPVDVVLCVGTDTGGWMETWNEVLAAVPAGQLHVRFLINRSTLLGGDGET